MLSEINPARAGLPGVMAHTAFVERKLCGEWAQLAVQPSCERRSPRSGVLSSGQVSDVGQFEQNVGMAGITDPAGADQVLATQLARIEAFLLNVIAIDELSRFAPSATLVGGLDVGLTA